MLCILLINAHPEITEGLVRQIGRANPEFEVAGVTGNVAESTRWISRYGAPDLVISSPQLEDGSFWDIFGQCELSCPVLFLPGEQNPEYQDSGDTLSAACLPLVARGDSITKALANVQTIREQFVQGGSALEAEQEEPKMKKTRITARKGREYVSMELANVCLCFFENGAVFLLTKDNKKYMLEAESLSEVYHDLDKTRFYRANRKFIFNVHYLSNYRLIGHNRILLELSIPTSEAIIISQHRSSEFRTWIDRI